MKNNTSFFIKALITLNMLFFMPIVLKADKPQENLESNDSTFKNSLEDAKFDMSEKLEFFKCSFECILNSNYPEICKLKCKTKSLQRIMAFKIKKLSDSIRS